MDIRDDESDLEVVRKGSTFCEHTWEHLITKVDFFGDPHYFWFCQRCLRIVKYEEVYEGQAGSKVGPKGDSKWKEYL